MVQSFLLEPLWGILLFTLVLYLTAIINLISLKKLSSFQPQEKTPFISVLVPSRNEAHNIEGCLKSLLAQKYANFEVLALDDESEDGTAEILERLAVNESRLKVLRGRPLPEGWAGKQWACHQLSARANGDMLMFTDADTRHHPLTLVNSASALAQTGAGFVSGIPRQIVKTAGEILLLPMLGWVILILLPLPLARRLRIPSMSVGVGQFLLFDRKAYIKIGGHKKVWNTSLEDVAFARLAIRQKFGWAFLDLSDRVACRMYRGFNEAVQGIGKNLIAFFEDRLLFLLFAWSWIAFLSWYPLFVLISGLTGTANQSAYLALVNLILLTGLWVLVNIRFGFPLWQAFVHPLTSAVYLVMAVKAAVLKLTGRTETWKGRHLPKETGQ
jgi:chlorobactene glucosyltransferase